MESVNPAGEQPIPWLQRQFENIWLLLAIGVLLPTIIYTAWSIYDLVELPYFPGTAQIAPAHGTRDAATTASAPAVVEGVTVGMKNLAFETRRLVVQAGTTVTWVNQDPFPHAVASGTPETPAEERLFPSSGDFPSGESFAFTFATPGEYQIYCSTPGHYQAGMTMTVVVEAP